MKKYGQIRWDLERSGKRIDNLDLLIGVTALQEGLILVTGNVKHFERIQGLKIENWMD
jgi:tRNA(fMet)-specific endonuclease VapC